MQGVADPLGFSRQVFLSLTHPSDPTMIGIIVIRFCHNLESSMARYTINLALTRGTRSKISEKASKQ